MTINDLNSRRAALQQQMSELQAKKAVCESRIAVLCEKLGLASVPTAEELKVLISDAEASLGAAQAALAQEESRMAAWEAKYATLSHGGAVGSPIDGAITTKETACSSSDAPVGSASAVTSNNWDFSGADESF